MEPQGLVADIGRNSATFALTGGPDGPTPRRARRYLMREHATFTDALLDYLRSVDQAGAAMHSVLAIAGSVDADVVNLTGSRWYISRSGVEAVLRRPPEMINECAAKALAISTLPATDFRASGGAARPVIAPDGAYLVLSPETGLGVAALLPGRGGPVAVESEAAHGNFAPQTDDERRLVQALAAGGRPVSNEAVLSAAGLVAAYRLTSARPDVRPEDITRGVGRDPAADSAITLFVGALGAVAGDLVLAFGAWTGVFLTGALASAVAPHFDRGQFHRRLADKRAFRSRLAKVPVATVGRGDLPLLGACARFASAAGRDGWTG